MDPKDLELFVLTHLVSARNRHGFMIVRQINGRYASNVTLKKMYRVLHLLENRGLLSRTINATTISGPPKWDYTLTADGRRYLVGLAPTIRAQVSHLQAAIAVIDQIEDAGGDSIDEVSA